MKDSAVGPAGLFDPRRQRRLLEGIRARLRHCSDRQQELSQQHARELIEEQQVFQAELASCKARCGARRREALEQWDSAEEELIQRYETETLRLRGELNRLAATYRRKLAEQRRDVKLELERRRQKIKKRHEEKRQRQESDLRNQHQRIAAALKPVQTCLRRSHEITLARLEHIPQISPLDNPWQELGESKPASLQEALQTIRRLEERCRQTVDQLQAGLAPRIVEGFYIPLGVAIFVMLWALIAYAAGPQPPWIAMLIGLPVGGLLGFLVYLVLLFPLKKLTRTVHPEIERIAQAAEKSAAVARQITSQRAKAAAAEVTKERDAKLESADARAQEQIDELTDQLSSEEREAREKLNAQLEQVEKEYGERSASLHNEMRDNAEKVAQEIQRALSDAEASIELRRAENAGRRQAELDKLGKRVELGVAGGVARIRAAEERLSRHFPDWSDVVDAEPPSCETVGSLPIGRLDLNRGGRPRLIDSETIATAEDAAANAVVSGFDESLLPDSMPLALHRRVHNGVLIEAAPTQLHKATALVHQLLWRLLTRALPSRAKLTLIDPVGRGQHFTSFMALADHDPAIVDHRVWTTEAKIESRLAALAHHVEDVLQSCLRDRFERIEDYNRAAGAMAEPYHAVAAVGFPEGLSREGYKHLRALIESGPRCGVFTLLVSDPAQPWPADMPAPGTDRLLKLRIDDDGGWHCESDGLRDYLLLPELPPPTDLRSRLVDQIGTAAVAASRVEIPLETLLPEEASGSGSTDDGIDITIGSQGANRGLSLQLGEGVRQHMLIAGKTGSGKSTLLHAIITSGIYRYRPDQLEFYLLDFKKGVEFKPYADALPPQIRVIGIESEREFGRSVLQRLDAELQQRGEQFRAEAVQELAAYREATGKPMPRILLVVDEFQELFVRDDRLAGDCAMLLDRLVRQGRSFGIHVILSSQSLAGAYSLPRATLGQMAVRVAMQCSESDAAMILADDNTAARLISRPGEAIYNDAGGLVEGNHPFQVAWLSSDRHQDLLKSVAKRDKRAFKRLPPAVIFEGNRPCKWTPALAAAASDFQDGGSNLKGLLGESVEIGPPVALELSRDAGRNVLLITPSSSRAAVLATTLAGFAYQQPQLRLIYCDGNRGDDDRVGSWLAKTGVQVEAVKPRDAEARIIELNDLVQRRTEEPDDDDPVVAVIDPLERFRDFRHDDSFSFSLDAAAKIGGAQALQQVLRDGPAANVYLVLVCGSAETLSRWLPRATQHDLELRVLGRLNASDSAMLIDTPLAAELSEATMLLYDDADGRVVKFRQCDRPSAASVKRWLKSAKRSDGAASGK